MLCTSTAPDRSHAMKLVTHLAQGMEEDQAWLAESWIHSSSKDRDHVEGAEWVGCGYLSHCGGSSFPSCPTSGEGVRGFRATILSSCQVLGHFRDYMLHPRLLLPTERPYGPGFLWLSMPEDTNSYIYQIQGILSFNTEKFYYIFVLPFCS